MTDAPERIHLDGDSEAGDGMFPRCFENPKYCSEPAIEYIRADLVAAMQARAEFSAAEVIPDHQPFVISEIGNYYGSLWVKREGGNDFWSIENYDGYDWLPCDPAVATALRALTEATP